jgi:hypothetical protein
MSIQTSNGQGKTRLPVTIARILLGLAFFIFGLNGFLHFIPQPKTVMPAGAMTFMTLMVKTHYFASLIFATQFIVGVLLLVNRFVPLALALIAPVIVNIIAFHLFLLPATIAPGIVVTLLEIYLAWSYRSSFAPLLSAVTTPG